MSIILVPHGGYVTACMMSAASLHFATTLKSQQQPHPLTVFLTFLRRTSIGPATIKIEDIKLGRQLSTIHVTLTQAATRDEVAGYFSYSNIHVESGLSLPTSWSLHPPPAPVDIMGLIQDHDENWKALSETVLFAPFRKASANMDFYVPRRDPADLSYVDQWLRFKNGEQFTMESLGMLCDMFLQVVEGYRERLDFIPQISNSSLNRNTEMVPQRLGIFWYPTILLNLEVKKVLPPAGADWLFVRVRPKQIKNGRMDLEVVILDKQSDLVALSNHVALIVDVGRNTAARRTEIETGTKL